ncbi:MAG: PleD family two-component response regulator [Planctomycetota bacterium]
MVDAADGDLVVVDPQADSAAMAGMPHGHAFSGVRALKLRRGVAVYVLVDTGDAIGVQLTRFTLADGVLMWNVEQQDLNTDELRSGALSQRRPSVDDLLARLQGEAGAHGQENSIQRLMRFERDDSLLTKLQDAETGLFDGHYATLKLDEEWKRSHRFHQPLSLLLLDLGFQGEISDVERRAGLAEAAGVFLNECRDIDVLARFSESVFLFLLPGTGAEGAQVLANRILGSLKERLQGQVAANSAGGLCTVPSADIANRKSFVAVAEACLTKAKAAGTGVVCSSWQ